MILARNRWLVKKFVNRTLNIPGLISYQAGQEISKGITLETAIDLQQTKRLPLSKPIIVNMIVCAVIGAAFGIPSRSIPAWLIGGLLFGLVMGLAMEAIFSRVQHRPRLYHRHLILLVLFEAVVTTFVFVPLYAARFSVYPVRFPITIDPADLGLTYENVTIPTADGVTLAGWYFPSQNGAAIIALHGYNGNRSQVIYHAQALIQHGYGVLALDLRAQGESSGDKSVGGWEGTVDIPAAVDFLQHRSDVDPQRIGAIGFSAGANTIINGAVETEGIQAIIADGLGANSREDVANPIPPQFQAIWGLMSPIYWMFDRGMEIFSGIPAASPFKMLLPQIAPRPILFITAGRDIEQFLGREYQKAAGETAELWELPDDIHIGGFLAHPQEYTERMVSFFDKHLLD